MSIPLENLDDKTYEELVRDALTRIPVYAPRWTDRNKTDPGVTFIELFAWLIEMQIYSLNRIDDKSRLKFLKLLGVPRPYPPMPAEVDLTFELKDGAQKAEILAGTAIANLNHMTGETILFETVSKVVSLSPSAPAATVHAVQGIWKSKEFQSDGLPDQALRMDESIFIRSSETTENALIVEVNGAKWKYIEDLDGSHATDTHFTANPEAGMITFGDGVHGKIPEKGRIVVRYRSGTGSRGNVKAGTIDQILDSKLAKNVVVKNSEAASGGTDSQETLESAIARARKDLREITRAITAADYEHLALACPGVKLARVKALEMYHPSYGYQVPTAVSVVIVPESSGPEAPTNPEQISVVKDHLENYRLLGTSLFVLSPQYVKVRVKTEVVKDPRYNDDSVIVAVKGALAEFLNPREGGGPDKRGWPFGRPVYLSEIMQVIDRTEGVDHVEDCKLFSCVESKWLESEEDKIRIQASSLIYSELKDQAVTILSGDEQAER